MIGIIDKLVRLSRRMRLESSRGPSAAELAGYLHLPLAEVRAALARAKDMVARELADDGKGGGTEVPGGLDEALAAEEEQALCRRFGIDGEPGQPGALPLDAATQANLRELTDKVLARLTPREREVLRKRFGIAMNPDHTLEEVGQQFTVTLERIRQIEAKALRKLARNNPEDD